MSNFRSFKLPVAAVNPSKERVQLVATSVWEEVAHSDDGAPAWRQVSTGITTDAFEPAEAVEKGYEVHDQLHVPASLSDYWPVVLIKFLRHARESGLRVEHEAR